MILWANHWLTFWCVWSCWTEQTINPRVMQTNPPLSLPTGRENTFFGNSWWTWVHWELSPSSQQRRLQRGTDCTHTDVCPKRRTVRWGTSVCCQMLCDDLLVFNLLVYYRLIWLWCVINMWIIKINGCLLSVGWNARYQGSPSLKWRICRDRMLAGLIGGGGWKEKCLFCLILLKDRLVYNSAKPNVHPLTEDASQSLVLNGLVRDSADCWFLPATLIEARGCNQQLSRQQFGVFNIVLHLNL